MLGAWDGVILISWEIELAVGGGSRAPVCCIAVIWPCAIVIKVICSNCSLIISKYTFQIEFDGCNSGRICRVGSGEPFSKKCPSPYHSCQKSVLLQYLQLAKWPMSRCYHNQHVLMLLTRPILWHLKNISQDMHVWKWQWPCLCQWHLGICKLQNGFQLELFCLLSMDQVDTKFMKLYSL